MQNGFRQTQRAELKLKVDPRLVLRSQMLQYTRQELEQAVETELADNPALERLEDDSEPITEEALLRVIAPQELGPSSEDAEFRRSLPNDDPDRPDWVEMTAADITLSERLAGQALGEGDIGRRHLDPIRPIRIVVGEASPELGVFTAGSEFLRSDHPKQRFFGDGLGVVFQALESGIVGEFGLDSLLKLLPGVLEHLAAEHQSWVNLELELGALCLSKPVLHVKILVGTFAVTRIIGRLGPLDSLGVLRGRFGS